jgi:homoserine O-acetyltransferase/O-succinyltransferase
MVDYEVFDLGDLRLQMGATLRDAKLAYKTYGELNQDRSNVVVYPPGTPASTTTTSG